MTTWANKADFFKRKPPKEQITISGLGDIVVQGLTTGQKDEYEDQVFHVEAGSREVKITQARAMLLQLTVFDQHGRPFFGEADLGQLLQTPAADTEPLYEAARRLSGMQTGEIEGLVKNSGAIAGCD